MLLYVYFFKGYSYDVYFWYMSYMQNPWKLEYIFWKGTVLLKELFDRPDFSLFFWQLLIFIFSCSACGILTGGRKKYVIVVFVFMSLFYLLTSQNALRQGVSISILFFGFVIYYIRQDIFVLILSVLTSYFLHKSGIIFALILIVFYCIHVSFKSNIKLAFFGFITGVLIYLMANIYLPEDSVYLNDIDWGDERTGSFFKFISILFLFVVSNIFIGFGRLDERFEFIYRLRVFVLFVLFPLSIAHEFFARIAYFYYMIDMVFSIVGYVYLDKKRQKLGALLPIIAAGVAPNSINLLLFSQRFIY